MGRVLLDRNKFIAQRCDSDSDTLYYHVFQFLPFAYILTWGAWVLYRKLSAASISERDRLSETTINPLRGDDSNRATITEYPGTVEVQAPGEEELDEECGKPRSFPVDARPRCLRGFWFKAFCMLIQISEAAASVIGFTYFSSQADLVSMSLILEAVMWLWAVGVLYVAPAEQHCTLPLFWALMLNTNLMRVCQITAFGLDDPVGVIILVKILLNFVLVLGTWRVYLGLVVAPILIVCLTCQMLVRCLQAVYAKCCSHVNHA